MAVAMVLAMVLAMWCCGCRACPRSIASMPRPVSASRRCLAAGPGITATGLCAMFRLNCAVGSVWAWWVTMGRVTAILELGAGFHPDFSGRDNLYFGGSLIGINHAAMARLESAIVAFSE